MELQHNPTLRVESFQMAEEGGGGDEEFDDDGRVKRTGHLLPFISPSLIYCYTYI